MKPETCNVQPETVNTRTFDFPEGQLTIAPDSVNEQPVIRVEFDSCKKFIPYDTFEQRYQAFEAFDQRNATELVRMLKSIQ